MKSKIIEVLSNYNEEITEDMNRDLFASDILDSFDIVKLVVELEETLGIEIDIDDVSPENFQTADAIIALVLSIVDK